MVATVTTLLAVIVSTSAVSDDNNLGQVVFSHVLFRHGSRMPLEFYPNDPHKDSANWPFKAAQLTDVGKKQEFELGLWLRQQYNGLLSHRYDPEEVYVQSTDVERTLMSAQCVMAGLYHSHDASGLAWEPVPVHTEPGVTDSVLAAASVCPCPAYNVEMKRVRDLPEVKALERKYKDMFEYLSNHTGSQVRTFGEDILIYDALSIEEEYNMSIPEWARPIYPEPLREAGLYSFVLPTWTTLLQRFKVGPLLKEMVKHFQDKRSGSLAPDRKVWFYSAHDATITAFLNTLKVFDIHFPPYAACVLLELRMIKEEYFVTLTYRNSTVAEPLLLPIKTCHTLCPLDQFLTLVHPLLPDNWAQECQLTAEITTEYFSPTAIAVLVVIDCLVLVVAIIFVVVIVRMCLLLREESPRTYRTMSTPRNIPQMLPTYPTYGAECHLPY